MERASFIRKSPALLTTSTQSVPQNNHCEISGPPTAVHVVMDDDDVHSCMTEFSSMPPEPALMKSKFTESSSSSSPLSVQDIAQVFQPKTPVVLLVKKDLHTTGVSSQEPRSPCRSEGRSSTLSKATPVPESSPILRGQKLFDSPKKTNEGLTSMSVSIIKNPLTAKSSSSVILREEKTFQGTSMPIVQQQRGTTSIQQQPFGSSALPVTRGRRTSFASIGSFLRLPKLQLEAGSHDHGGNSTTNWSTRNNPVSAESLAMRERQACSGASIISKSETVQQIIPSNVNGGGKPPTRSSTTTTSSPGKSWNVPKPAAAVSGSNHGSNASTSQVESSNTEVTQSESESKSVMTPPAELSSAITTSRSSTKAPPVSKVSVPSTGKEVTHSHQQRVSLLLQNWGARNMSSSGKPSDQNKDDTTENSETQPQASMSSSVEELIVGLGRKTSGEEQDERDKNTSTHFQEQEPPGNILSSPASTEESNDDASAAVEPLKSGQGSKSSSFSAAAAAAAECQQGEFNAAAEQQKEDSSGLPPRAPDTAGSSPNTRSILTKAKAKPPITVRKAFERNLHSARSDSMAYLFANRPVSQGVENWRGKMNSRRRSSQSFGCARSLSVGSARSSKGEETDKTISEPNKETALNESSERRRIRRLSRAESHFSPAAEKGKEKLRSRRMRISQDDKSLRPSINGIRGNSDESIISLMSAIPKEEESMITNNPSHGSFINDTVQKKLTKALAKIAELSKAHDADRAQWQASSVELAHAKKEHEAGLLEGYRQRMKIEGYETALAQKDSLLGSLQARLIAKPAEKATSPGESTTIKLLSAADEMEELQSTIVAKLTLENRRLLEERDIYQTQSRLQKEEIETMDDLESFLRTEVEEYKDMLDVAETRREVAEERVETMEKSERVNNREAAKAFEEFEKKLAKSNEIQKREIGRLAMENHQLLEERESLETQSRLMTETDSQVTLLREEAAQYKALFQTSQDDRRVSKSRISLLEKELETISQAMNSSTNDEAVSSQLADEELNESTKVRKQKEDHLTVDNRRLLDERESRLTRGRLHKEETESLEKCLKEMESKESSLQKEVGEYKALLETAQHEHEVSTKRLESMGKELQGSTGEAAGSKEAVEELKEMNEMQTQENDRLTIESHKLLKERESMQIHQENRLNEMESKESLLRKEIEDYRTIIEAAQNDYLESKKLSEELTKKNELQDENVDRLALESRQLLEERELIQTQLRERIEEIETLHNSQKEVGSQESLDRKQVEEYKYLLEISKDDNEEFRKRIEEMENALEKIAHDLKCANSEAEGSKEDFEELSKTNELEKEENDRLRSDLESQSGRLQNKSEKLSSSEELIALLTVEAEVWHEERKMLKEALKQQEGKVETLSKELSQIRQDSQAMETYLRVELESSKAENAAVLKVKALEETKGVELLENELEKAQIRIEEAQEIMAQLAEECELLRAKEQEQLEKITSLENQIKDATSSETADDDLSELRVEERARRELAEKEVETSRDRIEELEHSLKAQQEWASIYKKSIEFLEEKICKYDGTKIGVTGDDAQAADLEARSEPSCSVDEELQISGKHTLQDHDHETQEDETEEANKNAKERNSSTAVGGPCAAEGTHLNQADYIKSIVARQKGSGVPNNKRGWAPRLSDVFSRGPGINGDSIHNPSRIDALEAQNVKLQSDLVKLQALYKDDSYNARKKLKELEEENLAILKKYATLAEKSGNQLGRGI